jgi:hypothetical protein
MSAEKRPASEGLGAHQLVKRNRSDVNMQDGRAVAVVGSNAKSGALIQSVCVVRHSYTRVLTCQVPRTSGLQSPIMDLTGMI